MTTRRTFLQATATALAGSALAGCTALPGTDRRPAGPPVGAGPQRNDDPMAPHGPVGGSDDTYGPHGPGPDGHRYPDNHGDPDDHMYPTDDHRYPDGPMGPGSGPQYPDGQTDAESAALDRWFANVDNYVGVVDRTGEETVRVSVGAAGNGGGFAFEPAAVRVSPGTRVVWEWTGAGGSHDVAAVDTAFASDLFADAGHAFAVTFADAGTRYVCTPHRRLGMKGAVLVE